MVNCFLYSGKCENHFPVSSLNCSIFQKNKRVKCFHYHRISMKKVSNSILNNYDSKYFYCFHILNTKKFSQLFALIFPQLIIATPSYGICGENFNHLSDEKIYISEKKDTINEKKFFLAENLSNECSKSFDLPLLKRASDLLKEMDHHVSRPVKDALILLLATVFVVPLMRKFNTSPILGFLAAGLFLGPNGFGLVHRIGASKTLAEFGVVFFLFEMGLELSLSRLKSLGMDVFGLGSLQWLITGIFLGSISLLNNAPIEISVVIGFGLALSSSAFVLQLLSERGEVGTRFGRASFGILLFQDLAVVPLLVVVPLLAVGGGDFSSLLKALGTAAGKAAVALGIIFLGGRAFLEPVFRYAASAKSPEAFVATILVTVLAMSTLTESLGLSDTLGAFLAGVLLAETKYRHQIEADIAPFRGLLLGLFFITVGFGIDVSLMTGNFLIVSFLLVNLLLIKASIITALGRGFGLNFASSQRTGLILAQGGEFAFVTLGLAQKSNILAPQHAQLLFLLVALSMAMTPFLASTGSKISSSIERKRGLIGARKEDVQNAKDYVVVAGFGRVGQSVCELLDAKLVRYMAFDMNPGKVIEARNKGLPVFFGDACRPEVLKAAGIKTPKAVVVTLDDKHGASKAVNALRREYPTIQIFVRAKDAKHQKMLQLGGATAIVPELLESSLLLGGAVLLSYGTPIEEVNSLIEEARKKTLLDAGLDISGLSGYPASKPEEKAKNLIKNKDSYTETKDFQDF
jgi:CPA2 family monovalent cation:H+ antiporter-2